MNKATCFFRFFANIIKFLAKYTIIFEKDQETMAFHFQILQIFAIKYDVILFIFIN